MIAPRRYLQEFVLDIGAQTPGEWANRDPFLSRVNRVVQAASRVPSSVGVGDLAGLIRQAVLRCHLANDEPAELRVPRSRPWPDERDWATYGCEATPVGAEHFRINVLPWIPSWLDDGARRVVENAVAEIPRREKRQVPADPVVEAWTGFKTYTGVGQREAVRAAFFVPPGDTVVVQLPTGAGKTLAFQLPALVFGKSGGLVFVVTPTVALARDQEERFLSLLDQAGRERPSQGVQLAFHSGLGDEAKRAIASAIAGRQDSSIQIVFASPEAAVGVLRPALFRAAEAGRLSLFAVDEAHIINQWGHLFRPEFQSLAGLRNALLEACPRREQRFGTLLLTATLTSEGFEVLRQLFGASAGQVVAEPSLRPEPAYLLSASSDEEERRHRVLEATRFLPRPLILYTTRRDDAEGWYSRLRDERTGLRRVRLVRGGDLSGRAGENILEEWRRGDIEVVVATSAFGLGVDNASVRSVVHACLPETIDRYYQEVGRSGRDGNASVALLVSTPSDVRTARGLRSRLISVERGFERWEVMRQAYESAGDGVMRVSLDALPANIHEASDEGARWNLRTLVLMARAGMIEFVAKSPPEVKRKETESDADFEERRRALIERAFRTVTLRILDGRHTARTHWDSVVAPKRRELHAADERAIELVCELQDLRRPLNDVFREVYTIPELGIEPPRFVGSCPITRAERRDQFDQTPPYVRTLARNGATVGARFRDVLSTTNDPGRRAWIAYDASRNEGRNWENVRRSVTDLLRYAATDGIAEICTSDSMMGTKSWEELSAQSPYRFLVRSGVSSLADDSDLDGAKLPRITILDPRDAHAEYVNAAARLERPFHVIVLPRDTPDLRRSDRRFFDVHHFRNLDDILQELERWES